MSGEVAGATSPNLMISLRASVEDSDGPLDPILLGSFLKNFGALHNAFVQTSEDDSDLRELLLRFNVMNDIPLIESTITQNLDRRLSIAQDYFADHGSWLKHTKGSKEPKWLEVVSIEKNSPFFCLFSGLAVAVVGAVIFSGGKIKISPKGIEAQLAPFGVGLQSIRLAMRGGNAIRGRRQPRQIAQARQIAQEVDEED